MIWNRKNVPARTSSSGVANFLSDLKQAPVVAGTGRGRLIFGMDATASRQGTWDQACKIQASMFEAAAAVGGIEVKLVFYRGDECKSSKWSSSAGDLHRLMRVVSCIGGSTQIERVLTHAILETRNQKVNALIFVGDAMEENADRLCQLAGELGALGVPIFLFQEGRDETAAATFKQMAKLSRGAYLNFDLASVDRLKELLGAVAVYAAGGYAALVEHGKRRGGEVLRLTSQLQGK